MRLDYIHLRERVYQVLRREIVENRIGPGTKLKEVELAEHLGVSRTPVREAINMLGQDGLVEIVPRHGVFVKDLQAGDLRGIFEIREVLEGLAARLATRNDHQKLGLRLSRLYEGIGEKDFPNLERMSLLNRKFHDLLIASCQNERLVSILNNLHDALFLARIRTLPNADRARVSYSEHLQIIKAVKENDAEAAEILLRNHIRRAALDRLERMVGSVPQSSEKTRNPSENLLLFGGKRQ